MLKMLPHQASHLGLGGFCKWGIGLGIEFALLGRDPRRLHTAAGGIRVASACGAPGLLYENCLSYTYLDAALLIGAAYLLRASL